MKLISNSFNDGRPIPGEFAFAIIDADNHIAISNNRNPHLAWSDVPPETKSFALICHDYDVPSRLDDVNREDREIPESLRRDIFFHWILVDISPSVREIEAGGHSDGVTPKGKPGPDAPQGACHGINDYTKWFANDPDMSGNYYGYDGPCPPWNDSLPHHYVFTLYALAIAHVEVQDWGGDSVLRAITGHILAEASLTGTYTLNPRLMRSEAHK